VLFRSSVTNFGVDVPSAFKLIIRRDTDSIARAFAGNGYSAVALHPGFPWFYNRQNVYPWLGFEEFINISSFDETRDISGNYVSDFAMTDKMIDVYENYTAGG
jgi:phosphoglycerol transferase MdoB-like AlkP superfamily enzyme